MAEKRVSVRLAAVGGRQVRAELEGVGEAGARGFGRLSREMEAASEVVRVERRQHVGDPSFTNLQSITGDPRRELEIRERSGGEIVDDDHLRAGFEQVVHEMGTDEPCSTRDEDCAAIDHISLPATARPNTQPREA